MKLPVKAARKGVGRAAHYGAALRKLQPQARAATRGAKEVQVFQQASPSVVLVLTEDALGSGALISADGMIITNLHVVEDNDEVGVVFKPATQDAADAEPDILTAKVIRRDEVADLALLQVSDVPAGLKPLALGSSSAVPVGSDVHAIGHPTGEAWTYTRGIVSQVRKNYEWAAEDKIEHKATVIQTQTPINPGNSGGPLIDDALEIVGINSFSGTGEGLNFAVSAEDVKAFLARKGDRMVKGGPKVRAAAAKACELAVVAEEVNEDPKGLLMAIDADCDGKADFAAIHPDDPKEPDMMLFDEDGDGKVEAVLFDEGQDGKVEYGFYDTDHNGKPDLKGEFRNGEDEPYRWEKIAEN